MPRNTAPVFVPWPVPAALGVAAGAGLHHTLARPDGEGAAWIVGAGAPGPLPPVPTWPLGLLALVAAAALTACALRWRSARVWILLPLLVPAGWVRHAQREARPDPLAPLAGRTVELRGRSDGRLLHLEAPRGTVVALRPTGAVPRGVVRVRGRLRPAEGRRNPGGFDERAWLRRRDGDHVLLVDRVTPARHAGEPVRRAAAEPFRDRVRAGLARGLSGPRATLMRALVLGERAGADDLRDLFARAGLAHLLALSGLHLGVLAGAAGVLLAPLGPTRWALVAGLAVAFTLWIGPSPSLTRAAAMTAAAGLSAAGGAGRPHPFATLALAATGTLLVRPDWLHDPSFQLSYGSLLGILAFGAPAATALSAGRSARHPARWLVAGLVVSAAATTSTLPWTLSAFGRVPPLGPFVNVPALPLTGVLVPLGLAAGLLGAAWPPLADPLLALASPLAGLLIGLAEAGARLPVAAGPEVGSVGRGLWLTAALPWAWVVRGRLAPWRALAVTALACACALALPASRPVPELVILDVGQGDAILLRLPDRTEILIDGGGTPFSDYDVGAGVVTPALRALDVDELELVVASHADTDHVEGLASVLREVPTLALAYGRAAPGKAAWDALAAVAAARGVPLVPLRRGQTLRFGEAALHVLHPGARVGGSGNDDSLALRVDWRGRPFALLLGDVGAGVEAELAVPPAPLLLAPHHGSPHSTSEALLRAASPEVVAISVGTNGYGHPAPGVLDRATAAGAVVRRTDVDGALRFVPAW